MPNHHKVLERVARGQSVVLDGGVAAELERSGYKPEGPMLDAAAAREAPELLAAAHRAFVDAGADVLTAYTARTTVRALSRGGLGMRAAALTHRAVDIALEAAQRAGRPVAVAGAIGPLESAERPDATPPPQLLAQEHLEQAMRLATSGCDLVIVEAMPTLRESLAATAAVRRVMDVAWSTLAVGSAAKSPDGWPLAEAAAQLVSVGAVAVVLEGASAAELLDAVAALASAGLGVPVGARLRDGGERFADELALAVHRGAGIVGGGRGAGPDAIRALTARVRTRAAA